MAYKPARTLESVKRLNRLKTEEKRGSVPTTQGSYKHPVIPPLAPVKLPNVKAAAKGLGDVLREALSISNKQRSSTDKAAEAIKRSREKSRRGE